MTTPGIQMAAVTKRFAVEPAVDQLSLDVPEGRLLTLLGPSGCGKTTALRMIAGFELPDAGDIHIGGETMRHRPPERRPTAMVFQNYALWPHKTVFANVAFGLRVLGRPRASITARVDEVLRLVSLEGMAQRYPRQLSGGQRQRVALARALAVEPKVLLLDEPLSNLDAKLRVRMRGEIRALQQRLGITMIYVTHDQEEALSISDQVAVMNRGVLEQLGTPHEIYDAPVTAFVADFMGQANFLSGSAVSSASDGLVSAEVAGQALAARTRASLAAGDRVLLSIKSEHVRLAAAQGPNRLPARLIQAFFLGATTRWEVEAAGFRLQINVDGGRPASEGGAIFVELPPQNLVAFPQNAAAEASVFGV